MSQYRTHTKGYQNQIHKDRNHIDHIIRNRYMGPEHHHDHDSKRNHHLKQILKQQNNDQEILGNIYFRYYCPVRRHDPYASGYCFIKQIPHGQTYKDKDMKIFFFLSENHHENKPVYQHK